jgi:hypothetical protein
MTKRREFTPAQKRQIVERSKNEDGNICCEGCGLVLAGKAHEIDHIIPEGLRPDTDKRNPLTIADGQLLGKDCCHRGEDGKTSKDQAQIAKANRQFDKDSGLKRPKQSIPGRGFPKSTKAEKRVSKSLPPRKLYEEVR